MIAPSFGVDAYRRVAGAAVLDRTEEATVIASAQAGDRVARDRLVESCMQHALRRAVSLARFYQVMRGAALDPQDIAQEACLRALLRLDKALASPNPVGYLRRAIEGAMLTFCRERQSAVRVPMCMQSRGRRPVEVVPLGDLGGRAL